jgi:chromosome segregation ATPase
MDWLLLVLTMAFLFWSFQMIIVYRRQIERYDEQIGQVRANADEVFSQVEKYEHGHAEKKAELEKMKSDTARLDTKKKELDEKIKALKSADEIRRPTRFRLDAGDSAGN